MAFEIEIKAWVENPKELKEILDTKYTFIKEYKKIDTYYKVLNKNASIKQVRIREVKKKYILTFKKRNIENGVEVNEEHEFEISSKNEAEQLLLSIDCEKQLNKIKSGYLYKSNDYILEFSLVENLGHFIEIEKVIEIKDEKNIENIKLNLFSILEELNIPRSKIEEKTYTEMILNLNNL